MRTWPSGCFEIEVTDEKVAPFQALGFVAVDRVTTDEALESLGQLWDELFVEANRNRLGGWYEASRPFGDTGAASLTQLLFPEATVPELRDTQLVRSAHLAAERP